jgi:hypothetical protein
MVGKTSRTFASVWILFKTIICGYCPVKDIAIKNAVDNTYWDVVKFWNRTSLRRGDVRTTGFVFLGWQSDTRVWKSTI